MLKVHMLIGVHVDAPAPPDPVPPVPVPPDPLVPAAAVNALVNAVARSVAVGPAGMLIAEKRPFVCHALRVFANIKTI